MNAHTMFAVGDSARLIDSQTPGIVVAVKANDVKLRFEGGRALWFPPAMLERVR